MHARWLGADFVTGIQAVAPGVWFNSLVPWTAKDGTQVVSTTALMCGKRLDIHADN